VSSSSSSSSVSSGIRCLCVGVDDVWFRLFSFKIVVVKVVGSSSSTMIRC
jgi:hypothetical protein